MDNDNKPWYGVSFDQLQWSNPKFVPQLSGKLISARILAAQVMVYHYSGVICVKFMILK